MKMMDEAAAGEDGYVTFPAQGSALGKDHSGMKIGENFYPIPIPIPVSDFLRLLNDSAADVIELTEQYVRNKRLE